MTSCLRLTGNTGSYISCPSIPAMDNALTMSLDIVVKPDNWTNINPLISKGSGGTLQFQYFTNIGNQQSLTVRDVSVSTRNYNDTTFVPPFSGILPVGANWQANNGGGNSQTRFERSGVENPLVTAALSTGMIAGTDPIRIGSISTLYLTGNIYSFSISTDGVTRAALDFSLFDPGETSIVDAQGNVYTLNGDASIIDEPPSMSGVALRDWYSFWAD